MAFRRNLSLSRNKKSEKRYRTRGTHYSHLYLPILPIYSECPIPLKSHSIPSHNHTLYPHICTTHFSWLENKSPTVRSTPNYCETPFQRTFPLSIHQYIKVGNCCRCPPLFQTDSAKPSNVLRTNYSRIYLSRRNGPWTQPIPFLPDWITKWLTHSLLYSLQYSGHKYARTDYTTRPSLL